MDAVLEGTWGRWALEVKVGPVAPADLRGLLELSRRFPEYRPVLIGNESAPVPVERAGVEAMTWRDFLLGGPPGTPTTP